VDKPPIYLDFNATTPIASVVADAMLPYLYEHFGNPSSGHAYGRRTKEAVERARGQVARLIGAKPDEVVFTSGGTESNNMSILGVARGRRAHGRHVITSAVEHPAVSEPCKALEREGFEVTVVGVDESGHVDPAEIERALRSDTTLVTIMHANNEVGAIQPIRQVGDLAHAKGALVHTDAAQSISKVPVDVGALGVDLLTIAGHKLYAPKGVGALYVRDGVALETVTHGAAHERGIRAGTENVLEIVGLGRAAELAVERAATAPAKLAALRDRLWHRLESSGLDLRRNGGAEPTLPNTLSVGFKDVDATALLDEVQGRVAASAGAACHAEGVTISTVLEAMQVPLAYARGTVRLSVGHPTTEADVDEAGDALVEAARRLASSR
jgi:cysteine desulfurase